MEMSTIYTERDWQIMDASFAELRHYFRWAKYHGVPDGHEQEYFDLVSANFTLMLEIINNLRGGK